MIDGGSNVTADNVMICNHRIVDRWLLIGSSQCSMFNFIESSVVALLRTCTGKAGECPVWTYLYLLGVRVSRFPIGTSSNSIHLASTTYGKSRASSVESPTFLHDIKTDSCLATSAGLPLDYTKTDSTAPLAIRTTLFSIPHASTLIREKKQQNFKIGCEIPYGISPLIWYELCLLPVVFDTQPEF